MTEHFNWEQAAKDLWILLDDIDTGTDMFKPDNKHPFTKYVYSKLKIRFGILKSDGYELFPNEGYSSASK